MGEIQQVRADLAFTVPNPENVRLVPEFGGGALWDAGSYGTSFAQFVFGEAPVEVQGQQILGASGVDEVFHGQMRYSNGGVAQIGTSFRSPYHQAATLSGRGGRLELNSPFTPGAEHAEMVFYPRDGTPEKLDFRREETYLSQVENLQAAILDGAPIHLSLDRTRMHVETILALYAATR